MTDVLKSLLFRKEFITNYLGGTKLALNVDKNTLPQLTWSCFFIVKKEYANRYDKTGDD